MAGCPLVNPAVTGAYASQHGPCGAEDLPYCEDRVVINENFTRFTVLGFGISAKSVGYQLPVVDLEKKMRLAATAVDTVVIWIRPKCAE